MTAHKDLRMNQKCSVTIEKFILNKLKKILKNLISLYSLDNFSYFALCFEKVHSKNGTTASKDDANPRPSRLWRRCLAQSSSFVFIKKH